MDAMYALGLSIHSFATLAFLGIILLNLIVLYNIEDDNRYKRLNSIFLAPLTFVLYSFVVFAGVIMMAAKHLDFTVQNSAMVLLSLVVLYFEIKRTKALRFVVDQDAEVEEIIFSEYKSVFFKVLTIEFTGVLLISLWMWFG